MLTSLSRFRCAWVFGVVSAVACSVDSRTLSLGYDTPEGESGGRASEKPSATGGSSALGAAGDASVQHRDDAAPPIDAGAGDTDSEAPAATESCSGQPGERRCAVEGGSFLMGTSDAAVTTTVSSFELDEIEVTVARFRKYVASFSGAPAADAGVHPEIAHSGWRREWNAWLPSTQAELITTLHCNADWETWTDAAGEHEPYPLTCASYYLAFAFCAWSGGRLPTEAEWEYAASGGSQQRRYPWGNAEPSFELAQFDSSS